ncbi:MAG: hypothetical protein J3K34DRAFT_415356 [Monoraphidium minutum]|nr:MAG: hypothetical protein J3K34DRAFT_415356 [Monoraphidium minutum]
MCFTIQITAAMMVLNLGTAVFLTSRGHWLPRTQLFYTFFLMELLQFLQYLVLDDCNHWLNQLTTVLSYIHVCFQPLSVNMFLFQNEPNRDATRTIYKLCLVTGVLGVLRVPYLGLAHLPPAALELVPGLPDLKLAGTQAVCAWETVCGPRTCTTRGNLHLAWSLPLLPPSYFIPSGFVHFLMFFAPAFVMPGTWSFVRKVFAVVVVITGPMATQLASYRASGGDPSWRLEWAGVWCLFAAMQCLFGIFVEVVLGVHPEFMEPGEVGHAKYAEMVRSGKIFGGVRGVSPPGHDELMAAVKAVGGGGGAVGAPPPAEVLQRARAVVGGVKRKGA